MPENSAHENGSSEKRYSIGPDVVVQRLSETLVLINLQTDRIFELNSTGGRFVELIGNGLSRREIEQQMMSEFTVSEAELGQEIDGLILALAAEKLVQAGDDQ